jgi:prepilin-type N-terminal cleavage/methylation domain-containing protein
VVRSNRTPAPGTQGPETAEQLNRWAFTLVEIMMVVAIIGMLCVIAIPSYVRSREASTTKACMNNLRQIDGAKDRFAIENGKQDGYPVTQLDIEPYFLKKWEKCPAGGGYWINDVGTDPTCGLAGGHTI